MKNFFPPILAILVAFCGITSAVNECLDLDIGSRCSFESNHELDLNACGITDDDVVAGDLEACFASFGENNIHDLDLSSNDLTTLPAGIFDPLVAMTELNLFANQLTTLPAGIFDSLTALTRLSLSTNELTTLPAGIFDYLPALTVLSLSSNELTTLPAGIFDNLPALTDLYLLNNNLMMLPEGIFDSVAGLDDLLLSSNSLTTLPAGIFEPLEGLSLLTLAFNPDLECLPTVPLLGDIFIWVDDDEIGTECGCEFGDFADPCSEQGLQCTPGPVGYTCGPAPTPPPTPEAVETCDGGIVGIQVSDVCCSSSCGSCGGSGCTSREGGAESCCGGGVRASGRYCSVTGEAPCVTGPAPTPPPTPEGPAPTPAPTEAVEMCDGGVVGIQVSDVCCSSSCGSCGGSGCTSREGGAESCCGGGVRASGRYCSVTGEAPCVTGPAPTPAPTPEAVETCDGGIVGIQVSDVCCSSSCGSCGGSGCTSRDGGAESCCGGGVRASGRYCSVTGEAPCVTGPAPESTPAPTPEVETCDGGIVGIQRSDVCCALSCGSCGGSECSSRDGGGASCCYDDIKANGDLCSTTDSAPCIFDD